MKIYFAGSIRGGRDDQELYFSVIAELQKYGTVLTEHIGDKSLTGFGETQRTDKEIFERDMDWVREADVVVAEVTTPSLGVGYELGQAEAMGKPVLCLHREVEGKRLSAMLAGNDYFTIKKYANLDEAKSVMSEYFSK
ncbi:MAG TPA: nucleoside 2-deoxyribosyltransferase [Candidatus Paceibacterota bacterium]